LWLLVEAVVEPQVFWMLHQEVVVLAGLELAQGCL
jgi:hypothetical protein